MQRVRYILQTSMQRASTPGNVETFRGIAGEEAELPDDVAAMLAADGRVELLAAVRKPTAEAPPAPRPAKRQK